MPTLKPLYDLARGHSRFRKPTYQQNSTSHPSAKYPKQTSVDKTLRGSLKTASPFDTELDPWMNGDKDTLIGKGDITVRREWEVHHGSIESEGPPIAHLSEISCHRVDDAV